MNLDHRRSAVLWIALLSAAACTQHALIDEMRVVPSLLCPCDAVRVQVVFRHARRVEVTLDPPGRTEGFGSRAQPEPTVAPFTFTDVCEPAIASAVALLADPEPEPATAAINVPVLLGLELIPVTSAPTCGPGCAISGYAPIRFRDDRYSATILVQQVCNRSGRRVEIASGDGRTAELPFDGCSSELAGAPLVGSWSVHAQPRISPLEREVCPDPACTVGATGPLPGVAPGAPLALEFVVGCPPG